MDEQELKIQSSMEKGYTREQAERMIREQEQQLAEKFTRRRSFEERVASTSRNSIVDEGGGAPYMSQSHTRNPSSMSSYSVYSTNMQQQQYPDAVTVATSHGPHSNSYSQINAIGPEQLSLVMSKGYTREQAMMMSQREIRNIISGRSGGGGGGGGGSIGHRSSGSVATVDMPQVATNPNFNAWNTTYTYPGYHTQARTAGAHYFADPLPFQPHIQPQPQPLPQPVFYTSSSSSSSDFMESRRPHRHHRASFTASGSGSGGSGSGAFYDLNGHSGSMSSDYLHQQGMMLQPVNSSDSTVHTGYHRRVPAYIPSLSGSGSVHSGDNLRLDLEGNETVAPDVAVSANEPPIAYLASGPEVYEQLDGEQDEEEEQEDEILVLMETGYTRDQAIEFLRRNRPPSPGRSLFVVEGIQQQPSTGQAVLEPSTAIPLQARSPDPTVVQQRNRSDHELTGLYISNNSWKCSRKQCSCCRSNRCTALIICWVFIILGGIIIGVLFLYPRAVMISNDTSKYSLVPNNPSRSSIVQTYRISNNNWYEVSASNFQFSMTASPRASGPSGSRVSFTASGVPSTTSSPIASQKDILLTMTFSFFFLTKEQVQLASSVYSCNYTYFISGTYSVADWSTSKTNQFSSTLVFPCNVTRTNPAPSPSPTILPSKVPVPLPSTLPTRTPSFRVTAAPSTSSPSIFLTSSPSSLPPSSLTPSASPSSLTPSASPSSLTPSASPSSLTPSVSPSSLIPSVSPSSSTPSASPSSLTPSESPSLLPTT